MKAVSLAPDIKVEIVEIGHQMNQAGLPKEFIAAAVSTAFEFEGVYELLRMWADEDDAKERNETVVDIQELIDDCRQQEKVEGVYVRFDDLDGIAANIRAFKDNLRALVDQNGGLKKLSETTGIPQPSLSRFFNTASMPRRAMLNKIARALKLNQVQIATEWSR
ncbi:MAG: helix-turn-helix domain-containing protein [Pseudobdellovibrionaceae bacterium]